MSTRPLGFTLVEVLVSLAIVGVGLLTAIKTSTQAYRGFDRAIMVELASLSAENALAELIISSPSGTPLGERQFACNQLGRSFRCLRAVSVAPNPNFRRLDVRVLDDQGRTLVERTALVLVFL